MSDIHIPNTGTAYDGHSFEDYDQQFDDIEQLARYLLLEENNSPGFIAFRGFVADDATPWEDWRWLTCELLKDLEAPAIPIMIFGLQAVCAVADYLRE